MAQQFRNLVELYERSCVKYADRPLYGTKTDGAWRWTTYGEFHGLVDRFRGGLASLGVGKGDRVAIIADNRIEWAVAAYAAGSVLKNLRICGPANRSKARDPV